ncbi:MFS general substrate transporter-37 [Coleophoma cylindrospora]|uniref:MFS general substrate transporter-37 n=1 Tax=Coleophoma cylindrospora TaxID=1849047 RepID=A0A3D8RMM0_9HELO|nr:MFS general substrate transporter-37 [Coleophoma cylindrospora]
MSYVHPLQEAVQIAGETPLASAEKGPLVHADHTVIEQHGAYYPQNDAATEEELTTLRRVAGHIPITAYVLCMAEFAERGSFYGVKQVFSNFVNRPLPAGGNGAGAPPRGTQQTAGALGKGTVIAAAVVNSFCFLVYGLPVLCGWLADTRWGHFKTICIGIAICGVAHVIMVIAAIPSVIQNGHAFGPFMLSVYILAIGSALFKPSISVVVLDQNPHKKPITSTLPSGERVVIDPEATTERMMLWFYMLINVGGLLGIPTAYLAKLVGFWPAFLLPGIIYFLLPPLLWWLHPRIILHPPGGSDLGNTFKVLGTCLSHGGWKKIGRHGFWESAKPSVIATSSNPKQVDWNDNFVDDVQNTFQACGIFLFIPIFFINDGGIGGASDALSVMLTTNGVPNDVISNFNPLVIILGIPFVTYGFYPLLRKYKIHFGPIARMTTGFLICSIGSIGWAIITHYAYKTGPCGNYASSLNCVDADGVSLVSPISIWWTVIPLSITALCEILVNVTAYGIAYFRAPKNMRGLVSAIKCSMSAVQSAVNLATTPAIRDPFIVWAFAGPSIVGFVLAIVFWFMFKHLDNEEYVLNDEEDEYDMRNISGSDVGGSATVANAKDAEAGQDSKELRPRLTEAQ